MKRKSKQLCAHRESGKVRAGWKCRLPNVETASAIVGSAIVKLCGTYGKDCVRYVKEYVKSMKDAIR